jgi:predicted RNase H-related nuclease YkuK (DUF458 family)
MIVLYDTELEMDIPIEDANTEEEARKILGDMIGYYQAHSYTIIVKPDVSNS